MDVHFMVNPGHRWTNMTRYNSFVLNGVKYLCGTFVCVANDASIERQKAVVNHEPVHARQTSDDDWVAHILEIRASDEHHVYARVCWMYWPEELPAGTQDGERQVQGRQPYHGMHELIASNHMDIIDVVSVTSAAQVKHWHKEDEEIQHALYWRQAFDVRTYELSSVKPVCSCNAPENPDKLLIGCTAEHCKTWLHQQCIIDEARKATYRRLGRDQPHISSEHATENATVNATVNATENDTKRCSGLLFSVPITGTDGIVAGKENGNCGTVYSKNNMDVTMKDNNTQEVTETQPTSPSPESMSANPAARASISESFPGEPGRPQTRSEPNGDLFEPWDVMFQVSVELKSTSPVLKFRDLREGIVGGQKIWTEPVKCLVCASPID